MLLVLPVSHVDLGMALNMAKWAKGLGPYGRHRALIVWAKEIQHHDRRLFRTLVDGWGLELVAEIEPVLKLDEMGWPAGPNGMFRQTVMHIQRSADLRMPWYFFEADNLPIVPGWLDRIEADYMRTRHQYPCMGVLENSWVEARSGNTVKRIPVGKHLVGTAVYPWELMRFTTAFMSCGNRAFDVVMQNDLVPYYARHTNLIQHNWLTCNYRWQGDRLVCDAAEGKIPGQKGYALNHDVVIGTSVVVHGCKDGSLLSAMQGREKQVALLSTVVKDKPAKPRNVRKQPAVT